MADMVTFPLDRTKGLARGVVIVGFAFLALVFAAATLYLLLSCLVLPFVLDGLWETPLFLLPISVWTGWMAGNFTLMLGHILTCAEVSTGGVTLLRPLRKAKTYPWSEFQQVCICYSSSVPGKNDGMSVLCFIRHGEKRNIYDRWKTDNAWHYRRITVTDHSAELETAVRAVCPMEVKDLRGSIAYPDPNK